MERRLRVATMGFRQARSPEGKRALEGKKISLTLLKPLLETTEPRPNQLWVLPHSRFPLSKPPPPHINGSNGCTESPQGPLRNSAGVRYGPLCVD